MYSDLNNLPEGYSSGRTCKALGNSTCCFKCDRWGGWTICSNQRGRLLPDVMHFETIYEFTTAHEDDDKYRYTMVGYRLKNTVTDNGHVARGVCELNEAKSWLESQSVQRSAWRWNAFSRDDGETWTTIDGDTLVSMNMWGFTRSILDEISEDSRHSLRKVTGIRWNVSTTIRSQWPSGKRASNRKSAWIRR